MISFSRSTPGRPPRSAGVEVDDVGAAVAWQTAGTRVGRFGRPLGDVERDALTAALAEAAAAQADGTAESAVSGSGATDQVNGDGFGIRLDAGADAPPGASALVGLLRELLTDLLDHPVAALELDVADPAVTLRHLGREPLVVDTDDVTARATTFGADGSIVDQSSTIPDDPLGETGEGTVAPGWTHAFVDLALGTAVSRGARTVTVDGVWMDVRGDGTSRQVELVWMDGDDE